MKSLEEDLSAEIRQTRLFAGISVLTMHISFALEASQLIRIINPNLPVVWGGVHPTLYSAQTAADSAVDFVVQGEGEAPLLSFAKALEARKTCTEIKSLAFKINGVVKVNPLAPPFDVNMLETPNYESLELSAYLKKRSYNPPEDVVGLEYNGSRGCCYNCAFCINRVLPQQHVWRARTPAKVVADIKTIKEKYGVKYIFLEEEFPFVDRERSLELARLMAPLGLRWYGNIRVDVVYRDIELLKALRASGWCETSVGAESGSNRMLTHLKKGITVGQTLATAHILNELDVYCLYSFMTELPTETVDEKTETFTLMRKIRRIHANSEFIGAQTYRLYPGTEWYEIEKAEGRFNEPASLREWVTSGLSDFYAR